MEGSRETRERSGGMQLIPVVVGYSVVDSMVVGTGSVEVLGDVPALVTLLDSSAELVNLPVRAVGSAVGSAVKSRAGPD